jgi:hypothetical protein
MFIKRFRQTARQAQFGMIPRSQIGKIEKMFFVVDGESRQVII